MTFSSLIATTPAHTRWFSRFIGHCAAQASVAATILHMTPAKIEMKNWFISEKVFAMIFGFWFMEIVTKCSTCDVDDLQMHQRVADRGRRRANRKGKERKKNGLQSAIGFIWFLAFRMEEITDWLLDRQPYFVCYLFTILFWLSSRIVFNWVLSPIHFLTTLFFRNELI